MKIYSGILYIMYRFCISFGDLYVPALVAFLILGPNYDLYIDSIFFVFNLLDALGYAN